MVREFGELALNRHNHPTWTLDVKISLAFRGILLALNSLEEREYIQVPSTIHYPKPSPL
jgi:hypothetical protein